MFRDTARITDRRTYISKSLKSEAASLSMSLCRTDEGDF